MWWRTSDPIITLLVSARFKNRIIAGAVAIWINNTAVNFCFDIFPHNKNQKQFPYKMAAVRNRARSQSLSTSDTSCSSECSDTSTSSSSASNRLGYKNNVNQMNGKSPNFLMPEVSTTVKIKLSPSCATIVPVTECVTATVIKAPTPPPTLIINTNQTIPKSIITQASVTSTEESSDPLESDFSEEEVDDIDEEEVEDEEVEDEQEPEVAEEDKSTIPRERKEYELDDFQMIKTIGES